MKAFLEEYGLIIVVICIILLMLAFSQGALFSKIKTGLSNNVTSLSGMADKAVKQAETNTDSALNGSTDSGN